MTLEQIIKAFPSREEILKVFPSKDEILKAVPSREDLGKVIGFQERHSSGVSTLAAIGIFGSGILLGAGLALLFATPLNGDETAEHADGSPEEFGEGISEAHSPI